MKAGARGPLLKKAFLLLQSDQWEDALRELDRIEGSPTFAALPASAQSLVLSMKAEAMLKTGRVLDAAAVLSNATAIDEASSLNLAVVALDNNLSEYYKQARAALQKGIDERIRDPLTDILVKRLEEVVDELDRRIAADQ